VGRGEWISCGGGFFVKKGPGDKSGWGLHPEKNEKAETLERGYFGGGSIRGKADSKNLKTLTTFLAEGE